MTCRLLFRSVSLGFVSYRALVLNQRFYEPAKDHQTASGLTEYVEDVRTNAVPFQTPAWNRIPVSSWKNEDGWMSFSAHRTMSSSIARHKRARQGRVATEEPSSSAWKLVHYPALIFFRWREKRALSDLIALAPANADEARQKLVYLIAAMMADPATSDAIGIADAIKTLKPFEGTLAHCLSRRTTPLQ